MQPCAPECSELQIFSMVSASAPFATALVMAMPVAAGTADSWTGGFFLRRTNRTISDGSQRDDASDGASDDCAHRAAAGVLNRFAADELVREELVMTVGVGNGGGCSGGGGGETAGGGGLGSAGGGGGGESAVLVIVGSANTLVVTPFAARAA